MIRTLLEAASLGAHIQKGETGFRQRDLRFLIDLFWNWQSSAFVRHQLERVHNTQIQRYLQGLVVDAWAQSLSRAGHPQYRLTRAGFVGLVRALRERAREGDFQEYLFVSYLFANYRDRITKLAEKNGSPMPLSFREELGYWLDAARMKDEKAASIQREIAYWEQRIQETEGTIRFVQHARSSKREWSEVISDVENRFPYELNHQRPLSQLFQEVPQELQEWEMIEGNRFRIQQLWKPRLAILRSLLAELLKS